MLSLTRYQDEFAAGDFGDEFGSYLVSYATEHHLVEVHLFQAANGELVVFVTKSPGVRVADVREPVSAAVEQFLADRATTRPSIRYVYDPSGMAVSGSL
ncbi:MAG: hypothetical protein HY908_24490 [Myxococcales bacterium]|nr:hypothetical protein [Myxococcales bacterium]